MGCQGSDLSQGGLPAEMLAGTSLNALAGARLGTSGKRRNGGDGGQ